MTAWAARPIAARSRDCEKRHGVVGREPAAGHRVVEDPLHGHGVGIAAVACGFEGLRSDRATATRAGRIVGRRRARPAPVSRADGVVVEQRRGPPAPAARGRSGGCREGSPGTAARSGRAPPPRPRRWPRDSPCPQSRAAASSGSISAERRWPRPVRRPHGEHERQALSTGTTRRRDPRRAGSAPRCGADRPVADQEHRIGARVGESRHRSAAVSTCRPHVRTARRAGFGPAWRSSASPRRPRAWRPARAACGRTASRSSPGRGSRCRRRTRRGSHRHGRVRSTESGPTSSSRRASRSASRLGRS